MFDFPDYFPKRYSARHETDVQPSVPDPSVEEALVCFVGFLPFVCTNQSVHGWCKYTK